jgi:peptidoglycan/xylan/chitin deacetylase (PgdA/CDA1 family)
MKRRLIGLAMILAVAGAPAAAQSRPQIALTFDDMPAHGPLPPGETRLEIARRIVAALRTHRAPAHGFLNGGFGTEDPDSPRVLALWRRAGLPIGNHTWSHPNLEASTVPDYLAEVDRNAPLLANAVRWFRYPFLSEGADPAKRYAVRAGLRARGYRVAAVTMSFGDYAWNDAYARCAARGDDAAIVALERSFLDAARMQALRARALSREALGRDIPYVLLMHLGAFDARMLSRLLTLYEALGFRFVTLAQAQADPFYRAANDLTLPGPSPTLEGAARARGLAVPGADVCA